MIKINTYYLGRVVFWMIVFFNESLLKLIYGLASKISFLDMGIKRFGDGILILIYIVYAIVLIRQIVSNIVKKPVGDADILIETKSEKIFDVVKISVITIMISALVILLNQIILYPLILLLCLSIVSVVLTLKYKDGIYGESLYLFSQKILLEKISDYKTDEGIMVLRKIKKYKLFSLVTNYGFHAKVVDQKKIIELIRLD